MLRTDSSPVGPATIHAASSVIALIARRLHDKLRPMKSTPARRKPEFPIIISRGSVRVRIYRVVNRGRNIFTVAYRGTDGKRVRTTRSSLDTAKMEAERIATSIANGEIQALTLSNTDRAIYVRAVELLRPRGRELDTAIAELIESLDALNGTGSLLEAAKFFARHHSSGVKEKLLPEIYTEFLAAKKSDGVSIRYIQDCRSRLTRFVAKFSGKISECTTTALQDWLVRLEMKPRARNNMRTLIVTLFNFAKQRGYLPKERSTEADFLTKAKPASNAVGILRPADLSNLLLQCAPAFVPYIVIGAFAGLRQAELMRLDWSDVRLEQGFIEIRADKAKTAQRRLVPIQPNLARWIKPHIQEEGLLYVSGKTLARVTGTAKRLGIEWPNNALRHSYASYRLASCKNAAEVALEMGNSPRMIFEHYRELVTPADAEKWWSIIPKSEIIGGNIHHKARREKGTRKPGAKKL